MPRRPALIPLPAVIATALAEDLGEDWSVADDVTAAATISPGTAATAAFVSRAVGVVAGVEAVVETYRQVDAAVTARVQLRDGAGVEPGDVIAVVSGPARSVLVGERTALNLLTHLSGIATTTAGLVAAVAGTKCIIRDTRKTLPGLREVEKAAVLAGGGHNHRMALVDELLVKDNHVAAAGGMHQAATAALAAGRARGLPVQIEVDSLAQLDTALDAGCRRVMLDNFTLGDTAEGVRRCRAVTAATGDDVFVESSGGITRDSVRRIAEAGVDSVAVGALTHSSGALDIGLDITLEGI